MDTMTLGEVSQILRISEHTARNRLSQGLSMPPSFRIGRRRLFLRDEVHKWLLDKATLPAREKDDPAPGAGAVMARIA